MKTKFFKKNGFSFIEIMVATAIMAAAFLPIAELIRGSFHKVGDQRLEAAVATYAAEVMNEWMFVKRYKDICIDIDPANPNNTGTKHWGLIIPDKELDDGLVVQVVINVYEVDPDLATVPNDMTFEYVRIGYHSPNGCAGGAEHTLTSDPAGNTANQRNINSVNARDRPFPRNIDSKYGVGGTDLPPMVTIIMEFRWRGRWETWPVPLSARDKLWEHTNRKHLICRRANLQ